MKCIDREICQLEYAYQFNSDIQFFIRKDETVTRTLSWLDLRVIADVITLDLKQSHLLQKIASNFTICAPLVRMSIYRRLSCFIVHVRLIRRVHRNSTSFCSQGILSTSVWPSPQSRAPSRPGIRQIYFLHICLAVHQQGGSTTNARLHVMPTI